MNRRRLLGRIVEFGKNHGVFRKEITSSETLRMQKGLKDPAFVEVLIGVIMKKAKDSNSADLARVKNLYLALNDLRFDLEVKDIDKY